MIICPFLCLYSNYYIFKGTTEAIGAVESIMEHIAVKVGKDPTEVKMLNLRLGDFPFPALVNDLKLSSEYEKRAESIKLFNAVSIIQYSLLVNMKKTLLVRFMCKIQIETTRVILHNVNGYFPSKE